jgi:hypothetical protein
MEIIPKDILEFIEKANRLELDTLIIVNNAIIDMAKEKISNLDRNTA